MFTLIVNFLALMLLTTAGSSSGDECIENWFDCGNGKCISVVWQCDGDDDCGNLKDEENCEKTITENECLSSQFECVSDKHCIPKRWHCDGEKDCGDGSDEAKCDNVTQKCAGFRCRNNHCIPTQWHCDGNKDCFDGSDEAFCSPGDPCDNATCSHKCRSTPEGPQCYCNDGYLLDKKDNKTCLGDPCDNPTCSHKCRSTPEGQQCYCNDGYLLDKKDNKTCLDIDECQQEGFCSHEFTNLPGSYKCSCMNGYELINRTCKAKGSCCAGCDVGENYSCDTAITVNELLQEVRRADPLLVFTTLNEIRAMHLRTHQHFLIRRAAAKASAVDVDPKNERVYWLEISNRSSIYSAKTDGSDFRTVLNDGLLVPEDVAVDYIANNLYVTDSGLKQVLVCKIDGSMCSVLHDQNVGKPRSITLDLQKGKTFVYWSDWGEGTAGIYRSGMDGSHPIPVVTSDIAWPNGIAIDYSTTRLYWADAQLKKIEYISLNGNTRKVIYDTVFHPYAVAVFEDTVYWTDLGDFSLKSCNKFIGHNIKRLAREENVPIMGVHVYHPVLTFTVSNPCWSNECSHMCLTSPVSGFRCACSYGFQLDKDGKTCTIEKTSESLFVSEGSSVFHIIPKAVGKRTITELPLQISATISGISYDQNSHFLFITDDTPAIHALNTSSLRMRVLVKDNIKIPQGLAFDSRSNNLYWIDAGKGTVEVISIDSLKRIVLIENLKRPASLVISPARGIMFVSTTGFHPSVIKYGMDGKNGLVLHSIQGIPVALAVHPSKPNLYWADTSSGTISYIDYDNLRFPRILVRRAYNVTSVAASEEYIYWATTMRRELNLHKSNVTHVLQLPGEAKESILRKVTYSAAPFPTGKSECFIGNGGCSYLCLTSPGGRTCACPLKLMLDHDNVSCVARRCEDNDFKCVNGQCLPPSLRCDGHDDCDDGSDEINCDVACDTFSCNLTGQCIPWSKVCDGQKDCDDSSDESLQCSRSCLNNGGCTHICQKMPQGSKCLCSGGYMLLSDNKTCRDIDECKLLGTCSHFCNNTKGGFKCDCAEGYILHDHTLCKADGPATLIYLLKNQIRGFDLHSKSKHVIVNETNGDAVGMDYDASSETFFWAEKKDKSINLYSPKTGQREVILKSSLRPTDIRYDWIVGNLYIRDASSSILACTKDVKYCKTLINSTLPISSIDIAPNARLMFWTVWAIEKQNQYLGLIKRAEMDGSNKMTIVSDKINAPSTITVDRILNMIYWTDMELNTLECANFRGCERRKVMKTGSYNPIAISVFEDYVYWAHSGNDSIVKCNKLTGQDCTIIAKTTDKAEMLLIVHKAMQPSGVNECLNANCTELCLLTTSGAVCACDDTNKENCDVESELITPM